MSFFNKIKIENLPQKALALFIAIIIWVLTTNQKESNLTEVQFFIPVSYINLPRDLTLKSSPLRSTNISIEVPQGRVKDLHPGLFQVIVDLKDISIGSQQYQVTSKNISRPSGVNVLNIIPNVIDIEIEKLLEKELKIRAVTQGETAKDYALGEVKMIPEKVRLEGPSSIMEKITQINTKPINIQGLNSDIDMIISLIIPTGTRTLEQNTDFIARIKISSEPMSVRIFDVPIGIVNQNYVTRINPKKFNVLLRGPKSKLNNITKSDLQAFIDLSKYKPGTYKIKSPALYLDPSITVQKAWPPIDIWVLKQKIDE